MTRSEKLLRWILVPIVLLVAAFGWGVGHAQAGPFTKYGPVAGIQKSTGLTYVNTAAASADVVSLWAGSCSVSNFLRGDGTCAIPAGTGVTSVGASFAGSWYTVTGSPVTSTGTLAFGLTTGLTANSFLATPNATTGALSLRTIGNGDLPVVTVVKGGSGLATLTANSVLIGEGTSNINQVLLGADTVLRGTASADPVAAAVPNCGSSTTALNYNTTTHAFGCQTITSGGTGTVTNVATGTGLSGGPITSTGTLTVDQSFSPTWTGTQTFSTAPVLNAGFTGGTAVNASVTGNLSNGNTGGSAAALFTLTNNLGTDFAISLNGGSSTFTACGNCLNTGDTVTIRAGGSSGAISLATINSERVRIANDGRVSINAATADSSLVVSAVAGHYGTVMTAPNTASQSLGLNIVAGTNSSDFSLDIQNAGGSATRLLLLTGAGVLSAAANYSSIGAVSTTAAGVFTTSSDLRLKNVVGPATAGLKEVLKLKPIRYRWTQASGLDDPNHTVYSGFGAQDVLPLIPDAVGLNPNGYYSLSDRPITAALVNAVQSQQREISILEGIIACMAAYLALSFVVHNWKPRRV